MGMFRKEKDKRLKTMFYKRKVEIGLKRLKKKGLKRLSATVIVDLYGTEELKN